MVTANEQLLESSLFRVLEQKGIADDVANEIVKLLRDEVLPDIARQLQDLPFNSLKLNDFRLIQLRNAIENGMGWERVTARLNTSLREIMGEETQVTIEQLQQAAGPNINFIVPGPDLLQSIVIERPFSDGQLLDDWFSKLAQDTQNIIYNTIRSDMVQGKSIPEMAKDLLTREYDAFTTNGINKAVNNAKAVARTAANAVQNRARQAVYETNADVVAGVEYVATFDDRTTFICMALHGNIYPVDSGERPPQHVNCRSTTVPVLKSWEEMGVDPDTLRPDQRARLGGDIPQAESFDVWLKKQDTETQDKLLGPVRAEMYRSGKVTSVDGFVNEQGGTIPLKDFGLNRAGNPIETESA